MPNGCLEIDLERQDRLVAAMSFGVSNAVAAKFAGCSPSGVYGLMLRDDRFRQRVAQAKSGYALAVHCAHVGLTGENPLMLEALDWLASRGLLVGAEHYKQPSIISTDFETTKAAIQERPLDPKVGYGYGFCPEAECGAPSVSCQRCLDGLTFCESGHSYPHSSRVYRE